MNALTVGPGAHRAIAGPGVYPDLSGVSGAGQLETVIGALVTIVLVVAVAMIVVCAAVWALTTTHGNYHGAGKARAGLLIALGAAVLAGGADAWMSFLLHLGTTL
jgi:O-antigen/teichoic acid export membrane protein